MQNKIEIVIKIDKDKIKKLKEIGVSPQEVFIKGFYEILKQKYEDYITLDDDIEDVWEEGESIHFGQKNRFHTLLIPNENHENN